MNQTIIQGIGFVALTLVILSFQKNKRANILFIMLGGLLVFVIHYSLLQAWTGALMNLIEAGIVFVAYKKETSRWAQQRYWPLLFIALFVAAGYTTSNRLADILPIIAQVFGTIAVWQTNPKTIRYIMLIPRPLWFIYNFIVGSYAGMLTEVFIFTSVLTGIVRFDILRKKVK